MGICSSALNKAADAIPDDLKKKGMDKFLPVEITAKIEGDNVVATWKIVEPPPGTPDSLKHTITSSDWVGLYKEGSDSRNYLGGYQYNSDSKAEGSISIPVASHGAGKYFVRYCKANGYEELAISEGFVEWSPKATEAV